MKLKQRASMTAVDAYVRTPGRRLDVAGERRQSASGRRSRNATSWSPALPTASAPAHAPAGAQVSQADPG